MIKLIWSGLRDTLHYKIISIPIYKISLTLCIVELYVWHLTLTWKTRMLMNFLLPSLCFGLSGFLNVTEWTLNVWESDQKVHIHNMNEWKIHKKIYFSHLNKKYIFIYVVIWPLLSILPSFPSSIHPWSIHSHLQHGNACYP